MVLQWGRRNYPAETVSDQRNWHLSRWASMGPPELPGGNVSETAARIERYLELQWGRRNYPAETRRVSPADSQREPASMGPPELPGGNTGVQQGSSVDYYQLQWGRRNYPAETCAAACGSDDAPRCFNGAAGITRRKPGFP